MYWEITPHLNHDFDSVVVETDAEALAYAKAVVEDLWDQAEPDVEYTLKIQRCSGDMPAFVEEP